MHWTSFALGFITAVGLLGVVTVVWANHEFNRTSRLSFMKPD